MALAFLQFKSINDGHYIFQADIGTANFFRYVLAEKRNKLNVGKNEFIEVLTESKKVSKLFQINQAKNKINDGGFLLKIPTNEIRKNTRYVQLYSYQNQTTKVPSISNIVSLYPRIGKSNGVSDMAYSTSMKMESKNECKMHQTIVKNKEFNYKEPPLSKVMFWNTIINALPAIVQHAAPVIGSLLKDTNGSSTKQNSTQENDKTTQVINKVIEVLDVISKTANKAPAKTNETVQPTGNSMQNTATEHASDQLIQPTQSYKGVSSVRLSSAYVLESKTIIGLKPILEKILSPEAIMSIGDDPQKLFLAIKDAVQKTETDNNQNNAISVKVAPVSNQKDSDEKYSKAKIAPALLAALPALMPIIEKALDPKLIEAVGNQPVKLFQAIGDSVLKMNEQEMKHLEAINPGVDSADDIAKLLQGMSISSSKHKEDFIKFKMVKNLNLEFVNTKTVQFKNKERVIYSKNQRISIPFKITDANKAMLNKTFGKSMIQILVKNARTMDLVFRKDIKLINVDVSKYINEAFLTVEECKGIPCNTELKLELSYVWKSNKNENIGVFKSHYIHLIESYIFDRIGDRIGDPILLNDSNVHRDFWHKIWEGGFSKSIRWHVEFDLKYYYMLNLKEKDIARLETRNHVIDDNVEVGQEHPKRRKVNAKLKSGTELGINALNDALSLFNQQILDQQILEVLGKSDVDRSFQQVSRIRVELKGREGDTSTLWAYPEMSLYQLHLSQIGQVDELGQVTSLLPIQKVIPMPDFIHFIGTTSEH